MSNTTVTDMTMSYNYPLYPHEFTMKRTGLVLTTISGILSTISSLFILNVIRLSNQKLHTTHHRIMALMSVFDIMASVSMALTTLPMPSNDLLRFEGPMLGNHLTCQIQGWFIALGTIGGASMHSCLSLYFVCVIAFKMEQVKIAKLLEPKVFMCSMLLTLSCTIYIISQDMINITPRTSFCVISPNHDNCNGTSIDEVYFVCDTTMRGRFNVIARLYMILAVISVVMIVVAMMIIIITTLKKKTSMKCALRKQRFHLKESFESGEFDHDDNNETEARYREDSDERAVQELEHLRVIVVQALMYMFAYLVTFMVFYIPVLLPLSQKAEDVMLTLKSIFFPFQGVWNLIIFLYDKMFLLRQSDRSIGFWPSIKMVLFQKPSALEIVLPDSMQSADDSESEIESQPPQEVQQMYGLRLKRNYVTDDLPVAQDTRSAMSVSSPGRFLSYSAGSNRSSLPSS